MIQEMKNNHPKIGLGKFCRLLGITRQAYYQHFWLQEQLSFEDEHYIGGYKNQKESSSYGRKKVV